MYHTHQTIRVSAEFRNLNDDLLDPASVILILTHPDKSEETFLFSSPHTQIIRESAGQYHLDFELTDKGIWKYYWQGRSPDFEAEGATSFSVTDSPDWPA